MTSQLAHMTDYFNPMDCDDVVLDVIYNSIGHPLSNESDCEVPGMKVRGGLPTPCGLSAHVNGFGAGGGEISDQTSLFLDRIKSEGYNLPVASQHVTSINYNDHRNILPASVNNYHTNLSEFVVSNKMNNNGVSLELSNLQKANNLLQTSSSSAQYNNTGTAPLRLVNYNGQSNAPLQISTNVQSEQVQHSGNMGVSRPMLSPVSNNVNRPNPCRTRDMDEGHDGSGTGSAPKVMRTQGGLCKVCGDVASGMYFGALVCVPCKTFFLRYAGEAFSYECKYSKDCNISVTTRTQCKHCRYLKCLKAGMHRRVRPIHVQAPAGRQLCVVCRDIGNGIHFGVITCEGCKKFFRRGLKEHQTYTCKNGGNCPINPRTRNSCRFCRYQKCCRMGMSREAIQMGRPSKMILESNRLVNERLGDALDENLDEEERMEILQYFNTGADALYSSKDGSSINGLSLHNSSFGFPVDNFDVMKQSSFNDFSNNYKEGVRSGNMNEGHQIHHPSVLDVSESEIRPDISEALQHLKNASIMDELLNAAKLYEKNNDCGNRPSNLIEGELKINGVNQSNSGLYISAVKAKPKQDSGLQPLNGVDKTVAYRRQSCTEASAGSVWNIRAQAGSKSMDEGMKDSSASKNLENNSVRPGGVICKSEDGDNKVCASLIIDDLLSASSLMRNTTKKYTSPQQTLADIERMLIESSNQLEKRQRKNSETLTRSSSMEEEDLDLESLGSPTVSSSIRGLSLRLSDLHHAYESLCELSPEDIEVNVSDIEMELEEQESFPMPVEDDEILKEIKEYWIHPKLPTVMSLNENDRVAKSIYPAYLRFVAMGESLNKHLSMEFDKWCTIHGADPLELSKWITVRVITSFTSLSVAYCRSLPGFLEFDKRDQLKIVVDGQSPSRILIAALHWYESDRNNFKYFLSWRGKAPGRTDQFKEMLIKYAKVISKLNIDAVEAALLNALLIISTDYQNLANPGVIQKHREKILCLLKAYLDKKFGEDSNRLHVLFRCMPEARRLGLLHKHMTSTRTLTAEEVTTNLHPDDRKSVIASMELKLQSLT